VIVRRSASLTALELAKLRALLDVAYDGDFGDDDWLHALGGQHVLAFDGNELIAHASVVERGLLHQERRWKTGYVEALAVAPARRRAGLGSKVMEQVELMLQNEFELGALSTTDLALPLYERRGWQRWRGTTWVRRTAHDARQRTTTASSCGRSPRPSTCTGASPATSGVATSGDDHGA
jgi:aminoglycoside 2'-N-acetyltransferase I